MRKFLVYDTRKDRKESLSLAGVFTVVDLTDDEVDEIADLGIGEILMVDFTRIERTE